jgi:hypothetical protein
MLKIKLCFIAVAIVISVMGAFATRSRALCETQPQYYKYGSTYLPAGQYGVDYFCYNSAGNCTYYLLDPYDPNSFVPCRTGAFSWIY